MNLNKAINKMCLVFLCITFFISGKAFEYIGSTKVFIRYAQSINFSIRTLSLCLFVVFYLVEILLCFFFFKKNVKYSLTNKVSLNDKNEILIICGIILIFICYSFLLNHSSPAIGQRNLNSNLAILLWFAVSVILAPISEELFFRVILIESFEKVYGYHKWKSILFQAFLFYVPHFINANISFLVLYMGIINGILYYHSRSIVFPLIVHVLMNLTAFFAVVNIFHNRWIIGIPYMVSIFVIFALVIIFLLRRYMHIKGESFEIQKNA